MSGLEWCTVLGAALFLAIGFAGAAAASAGEAPWWDRRWRFRTPVCRPTPYRDRRPRPVEAAVDFPLLLARAGIRGEFDPASVRVVGRGSAREVPFALRTEFDVRAGRQQTYLCWTARPDLEPDGTYDLYFDTADWGIPAPPAGPEALPPENIVPNAGFEEEADGLPTGWTVNSPRLVRLGRFPHTAGRQSLQVVVDGDTPPEAERTVCICRTIDVRAFAGQEMAFACDLMAERARYGAPVCIELRQFRADGSRIREFAVQPRWLTIELAQGQLVQLCERGRFSPDAAALEVMISVRCVVRDADTDEVVTGPEAFFTVWADEVSVRPGERWPWPPASGAGFAEGALPDAPVNRGIAFSGQRRVAFNAASEGALTAALHDPPEAVHWGLASGTLEFWCRPSWAADDGREHVFFHGVAYGHRLQSRLRKVDASGDNAIEFSIADGGCTLRTVRGRADLRAGQWHHVAATWDFPGACLQVFVDGRRIGSEGPGAEAWPCSLDHGDGGKPWGIGISEEDKRSLPMQAFIGGDRECSAGLSAEATIDEVRISDAVRYREPFSPPRSEFQVDGNTRALFHFENDPHGVHAADDGFVEGHLICELPPREEAVALEVSEGGKIARRRVAVMPHAPEERFRANRAEARMTVTRPFRPLPDPRFVECRTRQAERTVFGDDDGFDLDVGGDLPPWMRWATFERAPGAGAETAKVPHWRANDSVLPFRVEDLAATLGADAADDAGRAFEAFRYALQTTNYYDAGFCETLPARHRERISYTLLKALNLFAFDQCGPLNHMLRKLFLAVGISSNNASGTHHQYEQAFYRGGWRLFDLSPRLYWLERDNATVLGWRGLEDDLYLKLRQGGPVYAWLPGRRSQATFGTAERPHCMDFPLRAGERVSLCWQNEGRWIERTKNREPVPLGKIPPYYGNGAVLYEPTPDGEAAELDNVAVERSGGASLICARDPARPAALTYRARCPYIVSDGQVRGAYTAGRPGDVRVSLSADGNGPWTEVWRNPDARGQVCVDLRDFVLCRYAYALRLDLAPGAAVAGLQVRSTFVASPLALPGRLSQGRNRIRFAGGRQGVPVRTRCCWVERFRSEISVSLNAVSYYLNGDEAHRNLFVSSPGGEAPVEVALYGLRQPARVRIEGLPLGWACETGPVAVGADGRAAFRLRAGGAGEGAICGFDVVVEAGSGQRRVPAQALVARAVLVREAEAADEIGGQAAPADLPEASGARAVAFSGDGRLGFAFDAPDAGRYALWLRARWEPGSSTKVQLVLDGRCRDLTAAAMIGFTDWDNPNRAHTKMFAHFGEQYGHWAWYRIPDVEVQAGANRLDLSAGAGAWFDALLLLPQHPAVDRAAMDLFQNWNYAPWDNPL